VAAFRAPFYFINLWLISDRHRYCTYLYYSGSVIERVFARTARCLGDAVAVVRARARQTQCRADVAFGAARRTESECAVWLTAVHPDGTAAHEVPARVVLDAVLDHADPVAHGAARAWYALGAHPAGTV
jgi:hypothetical protein